MKVETHSVKLLCACGFLNIILRIFDEQFEFFEEYSFYWQIDIVDVRSYTDDINILMIKTHIIAQIVSFGIYEGWQNINKHQNG